MERRAEGKERKERNGEGSRGRREESGETRGCWF